MITIVKICVISLALSGCASAPVYRPIPTYPGLTVVIKNPFECNSTLPDISKVKLYCAERSFLYHECRCSK